MQKVALFLRDEQIRFLDQMRARLGGVSREKLLKYLVDYWMDEERRLAAFEQDMKNWEKLRRDCPADTLRGLLKRIKKLGVAL